MTDETTTEQLAEIEGQAESTPATEYTPPEGWRVLAVGEVLRDGDERVQTDESRYATRQVGRSVQAHERYIRRIDTQAKPEPIQVREGRWKMRGGHHVSVAPMAGDDFDSIAYGYTWRGIDWPDLQWNNNGVHLIDSGARSKWDLVEYLGPIEADKTQELPDKTQELPEYTPPDGWRVVRFGEQLLSGDVWVNEDGTEQRSNILQWDASAVSGGRCIRRIGPQPEPVPDAAAIEELRSEVSYVQKLLGTEKRRVAELEDLVGSLRAINEAQEKAFDAAGQDNTALRNQLAAVKAELASVAADRQQLRVELDAAQQVPADSPELRQLRADLEQVTRERDTYRHAHELLLNDVNATHQRTKAMTVEAIAEWLQAFRGCNSPSLALLLLEALPSIMRSLTGLADDEDVD